MDFITIGAALSTLACLGFAYYWYRAYQAREAQAEEEGPEPTYGAVQAEEYREYLVERSSYQPVRQAVDFAAVGLCIMLGLLLFWTSQQADIGINPVNLTTYLMWMLTAWIIACGLVAAVRQALVLLMDMSDVQIDAARRGLDAQSTIVIKRVMAELQQNEGSSRKATAKESPAKEAPKAQEEPRKDSDYAPKERQLPSSASSQPIAAQAPLMAQRSAPREQPPSGDSNATQSPSRQDALPPQPGQRPSFEEQVARMAQQDRGRSAPPAGQGSPPPQPQQPRFGQPIPRGGYPPQQPGPQRVAPTERPRP